MLLLEKLDSFLESVSGPSIAKTLSKLAQEEDTESVLEDDAVNVDEKQQFQQEIVEIGSDLGISDEEYIKTWSLFRWKWLRKFIEKTYNPNNPDIPNYERYFTFKLDLFLMSWCCVSYCIKAIDQGNVANAYVTGMKEDLNFVGKQYNWLSTYFTIGYALMIIPSQIIITKVKPNIWIPSLELLWGILTAVCGAQTIHGAKQLYPLRFLIGVFEASSWPGVTVIIMNWYGPEEISSRAAGFGAAGIAGNLFTGFMQAAISKTLDNHLGLAGWRWLFIINGIMTVIVALAGFALLPSIPEEGGAFWVNKHDLAVAKLRVERFQKKSDIKFEFKDLWIAVKDYKVWAYVLAFTTWTWSNFGNGYFNLWLKSLKNTDGTKTYSTYQINLIPSGGYAVSFVMMLAWAKLCDLFNHRRFLVLEINALIGIFACALLAAWPDSRALIYLGYFLSFQMQATGPVMNSLLAEVYRKEPVLRSITVGFTVALVYGMDAWYSLVIWPATEAPHYKYGWNVSVAFETFSFFAIGFYFFVHKRTVIRLALEDSRASKLSA